MTKKIIEYLGEEEKTMIHFILQKLSEHKPPKVIHDQLSLVLEEEAEGFVIKLWRALIFEMLTFQQQQQKRKAPKA